MLILSSDVVVASLLGVLLETADFGPVYARSGEAPLVAFGRLHPDVVMVDCDRADACNAAFYSYVREHGAAALVFSPGRPAYEVREIAQQFGIVWFSLPIDRAELGRRVAEALSGVRRA